MRSLLLIGPLLLAACSGAGVAEPDPRATVLIVETSGGCAQLGPNCVTISVNGEGTVTAHRVTPQGPEIVDEATIDRALVTRLHREVKAIDQEELYATLPPGECRGCVDGVDTAMTFPIYPLPAITPTFSSVEVELDRSVPLFDAAWAVYEAAIAAIEVSVISR